MRLKRNINGNGRGKYSLIRNDRLAELDEATRTEVEIQIAALRELGVVTDGETEGPDEFFVIMLKDICAASALVGYAAAARVRCDDPEYADDIEELASRAGHMSPFCKKPD